MLLGRQHDRKNSPPKQTTKGPRSLNLPTSRRSRAVTASERTPQLSGEICGLALRGASSDPTRAADAPRVLKLAFEFLVLTAARWKEVRGAMWAEIDPREGVWAVPATRMKAKREHRVPLCCRAIDILEEAQALGDGTPIVFTIGDGQTIVEKHLRQLLTRLEIAAVPHGFRSSFRDWAAEETNHPREVIEAALAHMVRNKVEVAYRRTDLFERRRVLIEGWAAYLSGESEQVTDRSDLTTQPNRVVILSPPASQHF